MKNKILKVFVIVIISIAFTTNVLGQSTEKPANGREHKSTKIVKEKIPKPVIGNFSKDYPMAIREEWYGYPKFDFTNDWYYDPFLYSSNVPEYYIAEFAIDGYYYKVIYSKEGKKIAVHKKGVIDLPEPVLDAIRKSAYSAWEIGGEKEEIYKNNSLDQLKVYKIKVGKNPSEHDLFFSSDGQLLKDKTIK